MSANPPGVDQLDPVQLDFEEPTGLIEPMDEPQDPDTDTPPASPDGHHQTHSVPVDVDSVPVSEN
ncbi:hypothetical protein ALI22I_36560 [Saccharothrix sp. ALI-22-I]|uniref:hypothetical protein n=1 Tax=Saccharothrix sp. ALI-22-I TaxID=1933778 RepID=UPI00097C1425|nr:hypothetical protein [Saccharothrix sp. ALI-22-I]ONI81731.1 hypothetical protein ALI22I_36560 [Saccharothrix sp. ALI-22-I]